MPKKIIPIQKVEVLKDGLPNMDYIIMDFDVIQEGWNRYRLENGVIVKSKFVLINTMIDKSLEDFVKEAKEKKKPKMGLGITIQSRNILGVEAPKERRGGPSPKYTPKELRASVVKKDVEFEVIKEKRNTYKLANGIKIKVKHSPLEIAETNKFDARGLPIYLVNSTADIKIDFPEQVEKELEKIASQLSEQKNRSVSKKTNNGGESP